MTPAQTFTGDGLECEQTLPGGPPLLTAELDGSWRPDQILRGPFAGMQGGAVAAVLCRGIDELDLPWDFTTALTVQFFKPTLLGPLKVATKVLHGGRRAGVVEASLYNADGDCTAHGSATLISSRSDAGVPTPPETIHRPHLAKRRDILPSRHGDPWFMEAFDVREDDDGLVWFRLHRDIAAGAGPLTRVLPAADWAHGLWPALGARSGGLAAIPNLDLSVRLFRAPPSEWIGVGSASAWSAASVGVGWGDLYGESGLIGQVGMSIAVTMSDSA